MKTLLLAFTFALVALADPSLAQAPSGPARVTTPGQGQETISVVPGNGTTNSGPGSNGTVARSGTGADNATTNPAKAGNTSKPELGVPNDSTGGTGTTGK